jgi:RND family efflux transporter MFP subunit
MSSQKRRTGMVILMVLIIGIFALSGCQPEPLEETIPMSVRVITAETKLVEHSYRYIGMMDTESLQKLSFPANGKVDSIVVTEGDRVEEGQILATLDPETVQLQVDASRAQWEAARSQVEKASAAMKFARDTYEKMETLYQSGAVSAFERDQAKLQLDTLIEDRDSAYQVLEQAQAGYSGAGKIADESVIRATNSGHVVSVLNEPGEFVGAGYPVIILRGATSRVKLFVTQDQVVDLQVGKIARCTFGDQVCTGTIDWIAEVPDSATLTYEVQVKLEESDLRLGTIVNVDLILERVQAIQIPIQSIMNDESGDYIYVVENGNIGKKNIVRMEIDNTFVEVEGLEPGDQVVVMGMAYVEEGQGVSVREMGE